MSEHPRAVHGPAPHLTAVGVDGVQEAPVAGEVLVAQSLAAVLGEAGGRVLQDQGTVPSTRQREIAPSAKFVVNAYRPSGVTTAQQISLRPLPRDPVTGVN